MTHDRSQIGPIATMAQCIRPISLHALHLDYVRARAGSLDSPAVPSRGVLFLTLAKGDSAISWTESAYGRPDASKRDRCVLVRAQIGRMHPGVHIKECPDADTWTISTLPSQPMAAPRLSLYKVEPNLCHSLTMSCPLCSWLFSRQRQMLQVHQHSQHLSHSCSPSSRSEHQQRELKSPNSHSGRSTLRLRRGWS